MTLWTEAFETCPGTPPSTDPASLTRPSHLQASGSLLPLQWPRPGLLRGLQEPQQGREQGLAQALPSLEGIRWGVMEQLLTRDPLFLSLVLPAFAVCTKVHSACLSPSPRPHWPSVPAFQGLSLNIPPLLPQALVLVQPPRLGWVSLHTHKLMGLPCQHTQPTKFPSAWACPVGRQVMSYSSLNFPHLHNSRDRPGSHMGTLRKVLLQKTGKGHCWLRAQPKQR